MFTSIDTQLAHWLSDPLRLTAWASLSGIVSMLVYRRLSQQDRLRELEQQAAGVQQALRDHECAFADALPLLKQNIALALSRLKLALLPSLLAGLPILIVLVGLQASYHAKTVLPFGPAWARSWLAYFLAVSFAAGLLTKVVLRIR